MKKIQSNDQYDLYVDIEKNRAYLTIKGYWRNKEQVKNYLNDWEIAVNSLKRGFTLLTDATAMKAHPADVKELHQQAQGLIIKAGVKQVAEIQSNAIAHAQLNALSNESQMPKNNFKSREEAEAYLDSFQ